MLRKALALLLVSGFVGVAAGQCPAGESALTVWVDTDAWGYEVYWEIVSAGETCGSAPWAFGGNSTTVGCDGNGNGNGSSTYPNNAIVEEGPFCIPTDAEYDFIHVDDYGDGGTHFELLSDGELINVFNGTGDGNVWTFDPAVSSMVAHDSPCAAADIVVDGDTVTVSTVGATTQLGEPTPGANPIGGCAMQGWWCASDGNIARTVWLTFTANSSDPVEINTCHEGTTMDTQLALYRVEDCSDWSTYTLVGAQDDQPGGCGPGNGYAARLYSDCLEAGATYLIQLDGWGGSTGQSLVSVATNPSPAGTMNVAVSNITCPLSEEVLANGEILLNFSEGGRDVQCSIVGPGYSGATPYAGGLLAGVYTIEATNACGNSFTASVTLTEPEPFVFEFEEVDPSCDGALDGSISVDLSGGSEPYEWSWTTSGGFSSNEQNLSGVGAGWYGLEVTDDAGCAFTASVELVTGGALEFTLGPDTLICLDQTLLLYGPPALDYVWQDGSINQFLYIDANEWGVGTYPLYLIVSNDEGCEHSDVLILTIGSCTNGLEFATLDMPGVYPNPTSEVLHWQQPASMQSGQITDASGRIIDVLYESQGQLRVSDWLPGHYYILWKAADGRVSVERFQVAR